MSRAVLMEHTVDPAKEHLDRVKDYVKDIEPLAAEVLLAVYLRPEKTKSGLFLSDTSREEDRYQGKVGLVLKLGPIAFKDDATHSFGDRTPKIGDWVLINVGDTWAFDLGRQRCRFAEDVNIKAIINRPDIVW